jgi:hypothetical protein
MKPSPNAIVPEHILLFGLYGSGKTNSWVTWAKMQRETGTPGHFYVIGTEWGSMGRQWESDPSMEENCTYIDVDDWYTLTDATDKFLGALANPENGHRDVFVLEGGDKPWYWVQLLYDKLHGEPAVPVPRDPFAMEKGVSEVARDWVKINGVYRSWINPILRSHAHVVICTPQDAVRMPNPQKPKEWHDSPDIVEQYSRVGFRPSGQKELGHHLHTVLWMRSPGFARWTMTTVDDHTRQQVDNQPISNFAMDYLVKIAGWEL